MIDSSAVARVLGIAAHSPADGFGDGAQLINIAVNHAFNAPGLSVQGTATAGDNVPVTVTVDDSDGFTTTGVTLLNGASPLGSMANAGGGHWTMTLNAIVAGTHTLIGRRITAAGTADSAPSILVVSPVVPAGTGNLQVNTSSGSLQVDLTTGKLQTNN